MVHLSGKVIFALHQDFDFNRFSSRFYQIGDAAPLELRRLAVAFSHTDSDQAARKEEDVNQVQ